MEDLKVKFNQQEPPVRYGIVAGFVVLSLVMVLKVLPDLISAVGLGILLAILFIPYWLPTIIAYTRNHPSKGAIAVINCFFGWTFVGWVISLAWALSNNGRQNTVIVNNHVTGQAISAQPPVPTYQVGDVVNGHRFDGRAWIALPPAAPQPPPVVPTQEPPKTVDRGDLDRLQG